MGKTPRQPGRSKQQLGFKVTQLIFTEGGRQSHEEWHQERHNIFDELIRHGLPGEVVHPVEAMNYFARVTYIQKGDRLNAEIAQPKKLGEPEAPDPNTSAYCAPNDYVDGEGYPSTSGELLALILRWKLSALRHAASAVRKGKSSKSPVRAMSMLPRKTIAYVAMDLLEHNALTTRAPGPQLKELLRELLDLDETRNNSSRDYAAKHAVAQMIAQDERIGTRELARIVGVNPTTISRWRADDTFKQQVLRARRLFEIVGGFPTDQMAGD